MSEPITDLDLAERVAARIASLAAGRSLHSPPRRVLCAFYVAVGRHLGIEDEEIKPVLLTLEMFDQPVGDLAAVLAQDGLTVAANDEVGEIEGLVRGNDPDEVDRLLARAEALAKSTDGDERLDAVINRLEQYRRFWDEPVPCPACAGKGQAESPCAACSGDGKVPCKRCRWTGRISERKACPACQGTGKRFGVMACKQCAGSGSAETVAECPDCAGTGNVPCAECQGAGKKATPCAACAGSGRRLRRDLHRERASSSSSDE